jgi:hypothetical protein
LSMRNSLFDAMTSFHMIIFGTLQKDECRLKLTKL